MAKNKIKKNDNVLVIAGSHKGTTGTVIAISKDKQKVTIDKVNIVKKHVKPTQQNPEGGIQEFEAPIHISNVKLAPKGKEAKAAKKDAPKKAAPKKDAPKTEAPKKEAPKKEAAVKTEKKVEDK